MADGGMCTLVESCALHYMLNKHTSAMAESLNPFRKTFSDCDTVVVGLHIRMGGYAKLRYLL